MFLQLCVIGMKVLVGMFFCGLIGCSLAIVLSWIDILREGFSDGPDVKIPS